MVAMFNSAEYLRDPVVYDGVTGASARRGQPAAKPFVHLFDTTGIMQHNDIGPQWHPTDVGAIKVASHLLQYIKLTFGWALEATGPEYVASSPGKEKVMRVLIVICLGSFTRRCTGTTRRITECVPSAGRLRVCFRLSLAVSLSRSVSGKTRYCVCIGLGL